MKNKFIFITVLAFWFMLATIISFRVTSSLTKEKPQIVEILTDTLPLNQEHFIDINEHKNVNMTFDTLKFVVDKRSRGKDTIKKLEALFKRMEN